jgi:hypothetical protein
MPIPASVAAAVNGVLLAFWIVRKAPAGAALAAVTEQVLPALAVVAQDAYTVPERFHRSEPCEGTRLVMFQVIAAGT